MTKRILIVDDEPNIVISLEFLMKREGFQVSVAVDGQAALDKIAETIPDLVLLDVMMPKKSGFEVCQEVRANPAWRAIKIVMLTTYEGDEDIFQALTAGAKAYFPKTVAGAELLQAIRAVHAGQYCLPPDIAGKLAQRYSLPVLTPREREILERIAGGRSNKEIAALLNLAENTVKNHVHLILEKLGAQDRTQAVTNAIKRGILHIG